MRPSQLLILSGLTLSVACQKPSEGTPDDSSCVPSTEWCDGVDNDCDGETDEDDAVDVQIWYPDSDGDGYGVADAELAACAQPEGYAGNTDDCDDSREDVHPGAEEVAYDGAANDCQGSDLTDVDGDGFDAEIVGGDDCDDTDADINPDAQEVCDDLDRDEDCDGLADDDDPEGADGMLTVYPDSDGDDFGDSESDGRETCEPEDDEVADNTDCDDSDVEINTDAVEVCRDGVDNDCDGDPGACILEDASLGEASARLLGAEVGDLAGFSVAGVGDVNGDSYADLLIGAPQLPDHGASSSEGAAYLVLGGPLSGDLDLDTEAQASFIGATDCATAGFAVSGAGDMNGDGVPDLLIGSPGWDEYWVGDCGGVVTLVSGLASGSESLGTAGMTSIYGGLGDGMGLALDHAGDINNDGADDIIIGTSETADGGAAYLVFGPADSGSLDLGDTDAVLVAKLPGHDAGISVAGAGDVDGDGVDDLLVGAASASAANGDGEGGAAYLVLGPVGSGSLSLGAADLELLGEEGGSFAGFSVSGAGDVDGDGRDDFLVGALNASRAYLVRGSSEIGGVPSASLATATASFYGAEIGVGHDVSGAGDVDGDGLDDFLIGSKNDGDTRGAAYLVLGTPEGSLDLDTEADIKLSGETMDDYAGGALSRAGDVNGDGLDDFLVGASNSFDDALMDANRAYLVSWALW